MEEQLARSQAALVQDLIAKGIDPRIAGILGRVPRHRFVPPERIRDSYRDEALPIGSGQTISQPYVVATMTQAAEIRPDDRVLEVGTGSGYQTAVLAELARQVYTIELLPELIQRAYAILTNLGYTRIRYRLGDGTLGWKEAAPFDAIVVTAAAPEIPSTLADQLANGGRMVVPVGPEADQELVLVRRMGSELQVCPLCRVVFVKLIGREGYH
jgi:protein-L-isoaspartate(D-aspartate) O-methyltransferase